MEQKAIQKWDLDSLYEGKGQSHHLMDLFDELTKTLEKLESNLQTYQACAEPQLLLEILTQFQFALSGWEEVDDYSICVYAEDVADSAGVELMEKSAVLKAGLTSVQSNLDRVLGKIPQEIWDKWICSEDVEPLAFYLEERRAASKGLLPVEQEKIINALSVNGINAWEQQHELMLTQLKIPLEIDGEKKDVSIGQALHRAVHSAERQNRQAAAAAIEMVCAAEADAFAAIWNRVAGFRLDVYKQRGWDNVLKEALDHNRIQEKTLGSMMASIDANKTLYQAYFQRKIKVDQHEEISWFDIESPSFASTEKIVYADAKILISRQFHQFSEKLGSFADKAFEEGWIETENRPNKAEGGFCASMPLSKESRIFLTYRETYQDIVTLAHELGHAYHNFILHEEPVLVQQKGTSIAETASTFMENLVLDTVISHTANDEEKLALLEIKIIEGLKYLVTVPNMFRFEQQFYEQRKEGLLSAKEISGLLISTENAFYEESIEKLAAYQWMYISHFYDAEKSFYNIPYTIGYLFSNGVYAHSQRGADGFSKKYDELLRNSGKMTIEQLGESFLGADLANRDFWDAAQQPLKEAIEMYLQLTDKYGIKAE